VLQRESFKRVVKDGKTYYKILDRYFPVDTPSNLKGFDGDSLYSVGAIVVFYNNRDNASAYNKEVLEAGVDPIPHSHRRPLINYIQNGTAGDELEFDDKPGTISIPANEFEETDVHRDVEMVEVPQKDVSADEKRNAEIASNTVRALNEDLTPDKIALLANKARLLKAQKGKGTEKIHPLDQEGSDKMDPFDRFIRYKTRVYKTCTNVLDTNTDFSSVVSLLHSIKSRENAQNMIPKPPTAPNLQQRTGPAPTGYSRYDQEVFHISEDFNIQTGMSFHGKSLKNNKVEPKPIAEPVARPLKRPLSYASNNTSMNKSGKRPSRTPIIIIPASGTALISIFNARDILQDLKFVPTEQRKKEITRRENELLIQRRKDGGQTSPYRVIENPLRLSPEEWDRVVAVFVQGPAWQFKGWHWGGNPTEIFAHVCGFHLKFEDTKLDPNVAKWSVDVLQLSKTKRHLDKAIFIRLWQKIEQFIIRNKPDLRY